MSQADWLADVQVMTYRTYTATEQATLARLALARIYDELATAWNLYEQIVITDEDGQAQLDQNLRQPRSVVVISGAARRFLPRFSSVLSADASRGSGGSRGWMPVGVVTALEVTIQVAPAAEGVELLVSGYGRPSDPWSLYDRFAPLFAWAGAATGFQLQGDENARTRALNEYAVELDRANALADDFGFSGTGSMGAL